MSDLIQEIGQDIKTVETEVATWFETKVVPDAEADFQAFINYLKTNGGAVFYTLCQAVIQAAIAALTPGGSAVLFGSLVSTALTTAEKQGLTVTEDAAKAMLQTALTNLGGNSILTPPAAPATSS